MEKSFQIKNLDWYLISIVLLLSIAGLIVIYSATSGMDGSEKAGIFVRQVVFLIVGFVLAGTMILIPSKLLFAFAYIFYGFALGMLSVVWFQGQGGLERWIRIGGMSFQPSEFAKISVVIAVARYLSLCKIDQNKLKNLVIVFIMVAVPVYMIKEQPNLGTSLVVLSVLLPMLFWAGIQFFTLFILVSPFAAAVASSNPNMFLFWMIIVVAVIYFSKKSIYVIISLFMLNISVGVATPFLWKNALKPYQRERILSVFDTGSDKEGKNYQVNQSLLAIGSGGLGGKGFMDGTQTQLRFIPESQTDFIFSVLAEEFGFAGVSAILLLFFLLILRLITIAANTGKGFEGLIVYGFASILMFHVYVNIGMTVQIMPVTGLPLPFLSCGGSFLISIMIMIGITLGISVKKERF